MRLRGLATLFLVLALGPTGGAAQTAACESLLAADPAGREAARCLMEKAAGDGPAAAAARSELEEVARSRPSSAWPHFYLGHLDWERAERAERSFRRAAEGFALRGEPEGELYARENRVRLLFRLGRLDAADDEARAARRIGESSGDPALVAHGRLVLGRHLAQRGGDLALVDRLLSRLIPGGGSGPCSAGPYPTRRDCFLTLGNVNLDQGRGARAEQIFRQLVHLAQEHEDGYCEAAARYGLARAAIHDLREAGGVAGTGEAQRLAAEALRLAERYGHHGVEAKAHWILGVLSPAAEAELHLERCDEVAPSDRVRSYCLNALARRRARSDPSSAERTLERALELADDAGDPWTRAFAWREMMRVRWGATPGRRALADSWAALEAVETLRDLQPAGSAVQAGLFSTWSDDYSWLAGRLLEHAGSVRASWPVPEAFRVTERMRARALTTWIRKTDPDSAPEPGSGVFGELEEVREELARHEALLSFQVAPWQDPTGEFGGGSWLLALTREGVSIHRLPGRSDVRRAVRLFEGLVERRDGSEAGPAAHLYDQLLGPALAELPEGIGRLILVPDDALHRLPFAALRPAPGAMPLGARYELVRLPSATLWLQWRRERPAPAVRPLLVLADPELRGPERGGGGAPGGPEPQLAKVRSAVPEPVADSFGGLPHARREGRAAVRALGGGLLRIGPEASEAALVEGDPGRFGLVHFAAHAVTDEDRPERSAVLLAGSPAEGARYDGRLESAEIARLDLDGRTVVLASCRSADGAVLRGEGVMSLGRAFFQAGAHGVVASLWPLRDDESAALFSRFYRRLGDGATVAAALRGARRSSIEAGEPAAAWAGLVVLGDGGAVPVPGGRQGGRPAAPWWPVAGLLVLLTAILAATAFVRRKGI